MARRSSRRRKRPGSSPRSTPGEVTEKFTALWTKLGISYDGWAATTDPRHRQCVQRILQRLHDEGQLYKAEYGGYYSVRQEQFLTDKERGADGEFGPEWGEVVFLEEENWYFKLSHPSRLADRLSRGSSGLCLSRLPAHGTPQCGPQARWRSLHLPPAERLAWGIELPFDSGYVTYVWFDALINYISFAGYLSDGGDGLPNFDDLWPADAHVIGKDIIVPAHGIYWPIMLHALGFPG